MYTFEWDEEKNIINKNKHGVSFEEARSVFYDDNAWLEYDTYHSNCEDRFRIIGLSDANSLLVVVHCIRNETIIRIISARVATQNEKRNYERMLGI